MRRDAPDLVAVLVARTRLSTTIRRSRNAFANTPSSGPTARRPPRALASEMPHCPLAGGAPVHGCAFHTLDKRATRSLRKTRNRCSCWSSLQKQGSSFCIRSSSPRRRGSSSCSRNRNCSKQICNKAHRTPSQSRPAAHGWAAPVLAAMEGEARGAGLAGRAVRRRSDERGVGEQQHDATQRRNQTLSRNPQVAKRSGAVRAIRSVQCAMDGARPASCGWTFATCRGRT